MNDPKETKTTTEDVYVTGFGAPLHWRDHELIARKLQAREMARLTGLLREKLCRLVDNLLGSKALKTGRDDTSPLKGKSVLYSGGSA